MSYRQRIHTPSVMAIILGGGRGTRLYPLVKHRCKPAVPLAAKYRLIDIPISNCLHSEIRRIFVLSQFNSRSLNEHVTRTYQFGPLAHGRVEIIAASQGEEGKEDWFQGTADAVRRCLRYLPTERLTHVLVLSGDQLYTMNFGDVLASHEDSGAEITVACKEVSAEEAPRFGIMQTDNDGMIADFVEKPQTPDDLARVRSPNGSYWASMGIYLFNRVVLERILRECEGMDFGRDVIPYAVRSDYRVSGHAFNGYWEDIGTIASFYAANLGMVSQDPPIDLFDPSWDMYTRPRFLPPNKVQKSVMESVLMAEGCRVTGAKITRSVVGIRSIIKDGTEIENSILMGADYYVPEHGESRLPVMGIGRNVTIKRAIVDKNVRIGDGVKIINESQQTKADGPGWAIRDGIVVIEKGAVIPPGTVV